MIELILEQHEPIRSVLGSDRASAHLILTWQDQDVLVSIIVVLRPYEILLIYLLVNKG